MFFNVSCEKSGRPGQFCDDVLDMVWAAVGDLCPLAHASTCMLSSQYNDKYIQRTVQQQDVLARAFESRELGNKMTTNRA